MFSRPRLAFIAGAAACALVFAQPQPATAQSTPDTPPAGAAASMWLLQLTEPPLASYRGGVAGLAATSTGVTGADRLDAASPASVAYLDHLAQRQDELTTRIDRALDRPVEVAFRYRHAVNGLAVRVSAGEAAALADLPGVRSVAADTRLELDTDVSHELIGTPGVWEGQTGSGAGTRGEGVIVGMLDTGVNPDHPSFAAVDGDGYRHTNPLGAGNHLGVCAPEHPSHEDICNDKLIGAWNFAIGSAHARDDVGHGSHVGSTIAGNRHDAVFPVGNDTYTRTVQGVAPRANLISYKVCTSGGCWSSASLAAVDQAIADGVHALNFSISGPDNPWGNAVDQAFLAAFQAGVFVAASAGNSGPDAGTVAKTAPWNATVAATTNHRLIAHPLAMTGPAPVPPELAEVPAVPGDGVVVAEPLAGPIRYAGSVNPGNDEGCEPFPDGVFDGGLALIRRGDCNFSDKVDHAAAAGATAVVVSNQYGGAAFPMGALDGISIPAVMIGRDAGARLREVIDGNGATPTEVRIGSETTLVIDEGWADHVGDFSSRGPSSFDLLAPTFAAPGRGILAATAAAEGDPVRYEFMQGTSMAAPHATGAGALLAALHPDWSPARIRSALATSADRAGLVKEDAVTPADPFDVGSGELDVAAAGRAGLVLDETHENFVAANPDTGGDPKTLNLPAMVDQDCDDVCSWNRQVTSVAEVEAHYTVEVDAPDGMAVTVEPAAFTLAPGANQRLAVTVDVTDLVGGDWMFASLDLVTGDRHAPDGPPIAGAHLPMALIPAEAELTVDPAGLSTRQDVAEVVSQSLTIGNTGGAELAWEITESGSGCALPAWVEVAPRSGTVPPGGEQAVEVTFDSTGMTGGVYEAGLCLESNDPHRPAAVVPLALEVVEIPVVEVAPSSLAAAQPAGTVTGQTLTIDNAGYGTLAWSLAEAGAGPSPERIALLREGVLLVPDSTSNARWVMAFDPETGDLIDEQFIPFHAEADLFTPFHIIPTPDGDGFLMSDQVRRVVHEYDLAGNWRGVFAPAGGEDLEIAGNTRGIALSPEGTLLVTVASGGNADSVVEFDADGEYLGTYVDRELDGLDGPWDILFREDDMLVSASGSSAIHSFRRDGSASNPRFHDEFNWPGQLYEQDNGNILAASWGGSGSAAGVWELDAEGNLLDVYTGGGNGHQGVFALGNGNILTTNSGGVHEIDRAGNLVETEYDQRGRYITHVRLPDARPCVTPDQVPWLEASPDRARTAAGEPTEVTLTFDSRGLAPGEYQARLCLTSDDPATPLVPVPVSLTVSGPGCDRTITGDHRGPVVVSNGLTCLAYGADVTGPVTVRAGGSLFADGATVHGPLTAYRAGTVRLHGSTVAGATAIRGSTDELSLAGNVFTGPVVLAGNTTGEVPIVVAGNRIAGVLSCSGNAPPPVNQGEPNQVTGVKTGQCADL